VIHVRQPDDYTCGALRRRGVRCDDRFRSVRGLRLSEHALVRVVRVLPDFRRVGHLVVKRGRTWFDPALLAPFDGDPSPLVGGFPVWTRGSRITSELWIDTGS
jgi:hypothetical protein